LPHLWKEHSEQIGSCRNSREKEIVMQLKEHADDDRHCN